MTEKKTKEKKTLKEDDLNVVTGGAAKKTEIKQPIKDL